MGWVNNLSAIAINASRGNNNRPATRKQIGAIAGRLHKMIKETLRNKHGISAGEEYIRCLRLQFLQMVRDTTNRWHSDGLLTTNHLRFGEASAILDWMEGDTALGDIEAWVREIIGCYTEEMFE